MNELDQQTERLNAALRAATDFLASRGFNVAAHVPLAGPDLNGRQLWFGKVDGAFTLIATDVNGGEIPLLNASREMRVLAAARLDDLHRALINRNSMETRQVAAAAESVENLVLRWRQAVEVK